MSGSSATDSVTDSQLPIPNSQLPIPNSQCPIPNAQCPIPRYQLWLKADSDYQDFSTLPPRQTCQ
ncbi:MAG: hypothetical protein WBL95_22190 [Microcoleus sp.]